MIVNHRQISYVDDSHSNEWNATISQLGNSSEPTGHPTNHSEPPSQSVACLLVYMSDHVCTM